MALFIRFENSVGMDYFVATDFNPLNNKDAPDSKFRRNGLFLGNWFEIQPYNMGRADGSFYTFLKIP